MSHAYPFSFFTLIYRYTITHSASNDNVRLWNTELESSFNIYPEGAERPAKTSNTIPFTILPGHHGGCISHIGKRTLWRNSNESQANKKAYDSDWPHMSLHDYHIREPRMGWCVHQRMFVLWHCFDCLKSINASLFTNCTMQQAIVPTHDCTHDELMRITWAPLLLTWKGGIKQSCNYLYSVPIP